jgi:hypothetical protein
MKAERPEDAREAITDARRRSRQAAVMAIESYLATQISKEKPTHKRAETHKSIDSNGMD